MVLIVVAIIISIIIQYNLANPDVKTLRSLACLLMTLMPSFMIAGVVSGIYYNGEMFVIGKGRITTRDNPIFVTISLMFIVLLLLIPIICGVLIYLGKIQYGIKIHNIVYY